MEVKVKRLDEKATLPTYAHKGDVGMDIKAISVEYDLDKDLYIYHTGLSFESDFGIGQFLFVRSSNCKTDAYLTNHVGIADSAIYRGEIQFRFKTRDSLESIITNEQFKKFLELGYLDNMVMKEVREKVINDAINLKYAPYEVGDRIGQMVFFRYPSVNLTEVTELSDSDRGDGGFGSSGKK